MWGWAASRDITEGRVVPNLSPVTKAVRRRSSELYQLTTFTNNTLLLNWIPRHISHILKGHTSQFDHRVLIQSCPARAKNFTNYVFCHPQFSGVIQNIENRCAIKAKLSKNQFLLYKIDYFDNNRHRQTGVKMAQWFSIFWIPPLNCGCQNT